MSDPRQTRWGSCPPETGRARLAGTSYAPGRTCVDVTWPPGNHFTCSACGTQWHALRRLESGEWSRPGDGMRYCPGCGARIAVERLP